MFGYSADEIIGRPIRLIIPADRQSEEDRVLATIRAGQTVEHFETVRQRKDGTSIEISLTVSPVRARDGTVIGASKIARDVSEQRRLTRRAEEAARAKDEFLAMLSHELRTPLNAVLGYTRMLRDGRFTEERRDEVFEIIERNARILSQLVSDVLDVSGIVTGKVRLTLQACDVAGPLRAAVDSVRPSADAKGVAVAADDARRAGEGVVRRRSDAAGVLEPALERRQVHAARRRRARDARRARRHDFGRRRRQRDRDPPRVAAVPVSAILAGRDTCTRASLAGMGLGLALARHFVELHGGTISAVSEGRGPRLDVHRDAAPRAVATKDTKFSPQRTQRTQRNSTSFFVLLCDLCGYYFVLFVACVTKLIPPITAPWGTSIGAAAVASEVPG